MNGIVTSAKNLLKPQNRWKYIKLLKFLFWPLKDLVEDGKFRILFNFQFKALTCLPILFVIFS